MSDANTLPVAVTPAVEPAGSTAAPVAAPADAVVAVASVAVEPAKATPSKFAAVKANYEHALATVKADYELAFGEVKGDIAFVKSHALAFAIVGGALFAAGFVLKMII